MKINNQNFSVASTIHGWCKTAIRTQSPALSCTIGPSRVFIWRVPIGSLLFSPFFLIAYRDDFGLATLRTKALLNISHFLFLSIDLTVVCSVKVFYHIYSPTGNKQLTEIWYYTGLNQTDCHQEVTILRPNVSTLLSSTFNQGWKPVSLSTPQRRPKSQTRWKHNVFIASVIEIQMTAILSNADSDVRESVDPCNTSLTRFFSQIRYIKVMLCCSFYIYNIPDMPWNAQMAFIF